MENEIAVRNKEFVLDIENESASYSSMECVTQKDKVLFYNAVSSPGENLRDHINEVVNVKDVFIEVIDLDQDDGTVTQAPRIVLIDVDGVGYQCVSGGVLNALKRIIKIFGHPTWENGLMLKVKQINRGERQVLTLVAV